MNDTLKSSSFVNVSVSEQEKQRIAQEEAFWTAPKLVVLTAVTLTLSIIALYVMASV